MPANHTYPELLDANAYIRKASDSFYLQCTTRTVQESKLFPVNPYIALSYLNAWYRWPELLRKIDAAMPAEEIGDRAREVGSYAQRHHASALIPQFYLGGRQILLDMGMLKPTDALDDVAVRARLRRSGSTSPTTATTRTCCPATPATARRSSPSARPQVFEARRARRHARRPAAHRARALPGHRRRRTAFLSHCECRLSFNNHGPYRTKGGNEMLVRDCVDLGECDYPWIDGVGAEHRAQQPHDPRDHEGHPLQHRRRLGLLRGHARLRPRQHHRGRRSTPPTTSPTATSRSTWTRPTTSPTTSTHQREKMNEATAGMWKMIAGWTRDQMIDAGAARLLRRRQGPRALRRRLRAGRLVHASTSACSASSRCSTTSTAAISIAELVGLRLA